MGSDGCQVECNDVTYTDEELLEHTDVCKCSYAEKPIEIIVGLYQIQKDDDGADDDDGANDDDNDVYEANASVLPYNNDDGANDDDGNKDNDDGANDDDSALGAPVPTLQWDCGCASSSILDCSCTGSGCTSEGFAACLAESSCPTTRFTRDYADVYCSVGNSQTANIIDSINGFNLAPSSSSSLGRIDDDGQNDDDGNGANDDGANDDDNGRGIRIDDDNANDDGGNGANDDGANDDDNGRGTGN